MTILKSRFKHVTVLSGKTPVLGATADEWDKALTGNMRQTLVEVKRKASSGVKRVYDNSVDYEQATLQALIDGDAGLSVIETAREWVHKRLVKPLQDREQEVQELSREIDRRKLVLIDTDELRGQYSGTIIATTRYFVAQFDLQRQSAVIHDRLMLDTSREGARLDYEVGMVLDVIYHETSAPGTALFPNSDDDLTSGL